MLTNYLVIGANDSKGYLLIHILMDLCQILTVLEKQSIGICGGMIYDSSQFLGTEIDFWKVRIDHSQDTSLCSEDGDIIKPQRSTLILLLSLLLLLCTTGYAYSELILTEAHKCGIHTHSVHSEES